MNGQRDDGTESQSRQLYQQQGTHTEIQTNENPDVDTGRHLKQAQTQIDNMDAIYPDRTDLYMQADIKVD